MKSYLEQDIDYLVSNLDILSELKDKSILITGATGLLGSFMVKVLCEYNKRNNASVRIIALVRNIKKAESIFRPYLDDDSLSFIAGDVSEKITTAKNIDYIIHGASVTSSKMFVEKPVETIQTLIDGTKSMLNLAHEKNAVNIVFMSSLEVYGVPDRENYQVSEDYVGYIDFTNIRSCYSEGKRMAECLCNSFAKEYGIKVSTVRLSQTFGPGVAYEDDRVFAQFARSVINHENISLNTEGRTYRNYCYLRDAVAGIFYGLIKGENCEAYNIANKDTGISIADMAQLVCSSKKLGNGQIEVIFNHPEEISQFGYNPEMKIELVTDKLEKLGWKAEVGLEDMYFRMIEDMRESMRRVN